MTGQTERRSREGAMPPEEGLAYEPNPKHKEPWQRGARGSLCPKGRPKGADARADDEVRESWGSFTIWTRGENLCAHVEQGEVVDSAHWYMLPLMEWLADNWDPLLHEERLPLRNAGVSAAESLSQTRMPP